MVEFLRWTDFEELQSFWLLFGITFISTPIRIIILLLCCPSYMFISNDALLPDAPSIHLRHSASGGIIFRIHWIEMKCRDLPNHETIFYSFRVARQMAWEMGAPQFFSLESKRPYAYRR
jgi:hypothetical protein